MEYKYIYKNTVFELWQLSIYHIYGSMVGICNVVFTAAMAALIKTKWEAVSDFIRFLLLFGCILFPVIQPVIIYFNAKKQAFAIAQNTELCFDDNGVHIKAGTQNSDILWDKIKRVSKKPTMIIVFSDTTHGFVLTNRVLGNQRAAFYEYIRSKIS